VQEVVVHLQPSTIQTLLQQNIDLSRNLDVLSTSAPSRDTFGIATGPPVVWIRIEVGVTVIHPQAPDLLPRYWRLWTTRHTTVGQVRTPLGPQLCAARCTIQALALYQIDRHRYTTQWSSHPFPHEQTIVLSSHSSPWISATWRFYPLRWPNEFHFHAWKTYTLVRPEVQTARRFIRAYKLLASVHVADRLVSLQFIVAFF